MDRLFSGMRDPFHDIVIPVRAIGAIEVVAGGLVFGAVLAGAPEILAAEALELAAGKAWATGMALAGGTGMMSSGVAELVTNKNMREALKGIDKALHPIELGITTVFPQAESVIGTIDNVQESRHLLKGPGIERIRAAGEILGKALDAVRESPKIDGSDSKGNQGRGDARADAPASKSQSPLPAPSVRSSTPP